MFYAQSWLKVAISLSWLFEGQRVTYWTPSPRDAWGKFSACTIGNIPPSVELLAEFGHPVWKALPGHALNYS